MLYEDRRTSLFCQCCSGEGIEFTEIENYIYATVFKPVSKYNGSEYRQMKKDARKGKVVFDIVLTLEQVDEFKNWLLNSSLEDDAEHKEYSIKIERYKEIELYLLSVYSTTKGLKNLESMRFGRNHIKEWIRGIEVNE